MSQAPDAPGSSRENRVDPGRVREEPGQCRGSRIAAVKSCQPVSVWETEKR